MNRPLLLALAAALLAPTAVAPERPATATPTPAAPGGAGYLVEVADEGYIWQLDPSQPFVLCVEETTGHVVRGPSLVLQAFVRTADGFDIGPEIATGATGEFADAEVGDCTRTTLDRD
ncbi:MAG: hypothetical protein M3Q10_04115 [Chloroflexota bacterium]|nr:hypothetical protein [Chloroflexota bacterium]